MLNTLVDLPLYIQIVLVTGYIGYSVANQGYRENERKDALLYGVLIYGLIGWLIFYSMTLLSKSLPMIISALVAAVIICWLVGVLWRVKGRSWYFELLNAKRITNENDLGTVWNRLHQDISIYKTQVVVTLNDGTKLCCNAVRDFKTAAVPLCETDNKGNIALYVTKKKRPEWEGFKIVEDVRHPSWGDNLTYIPSKEIKYVEFRYKSKST